jgi:tetratricopeptide (TPR) repeat protein
LIALCALLAPEPVPLFLFLDTLVQPRGPLEIDGVEEAIAALRAFALVDREAIPDERDPTITTDTVRLHRLIREVAAKRVHGNALVAAQRTLIEIMESVYPQDPEDPSGWPRARRLDAIAADMVRAEIDLPAGTELKAAALMTRLGNYRYLAVGNYSGTLPILKRTLEICEKYLGPEHQNTATSVNNLAIFLEAQNDLVGAQLLYERALVIRQKVFGPEHPTTADSLDNLGTCRFKQGEAAEARRLLERSLEIRRKTLGVDDPSKVLGLVNLAAVIMEQGDFTSARPLFERALELSDRVFGRNHPDTAMVLFNLARLHEHENDLASARALLRLALAICEKVLGPEHPNTFRVRINLANLD